MKQGVLMGEGVIGLVLILIIVIDLCSENENDYEDENDLVAYSETAWVSTHRTAWRMRAVASFNSSFSLTWLRCTSTVLGLR